MNSAEEASKPLSCQSPAARSADRANVVAYQPRVGVDQIGKSLVLPGARNDAEQVPLCLAFRLPGCRVTRKSGAVSEGECAAAEGNDGRRDNVSDHAQLIDKSSDNLS
jgi:hypothetical protein